jgi:16S rRNA U516 pseudouridylate synthase RsuA-like enzyme
MTKIRLQVALAKAGIAARRKAASIIGAGRVKVNGKVASERGFRVDIAKDKVTLDGRVLSFGAAKCYYILNKPAGVVSTVKDERGRKKVTDYVRGKGVRIYPVGRLDKDTTGLIILTNDGELTYRLTHPKFGVERVYEATVKGEVDGKDLLRLKSGIVVEGKSAKAEKVLIKKRCLSLR